MVHLRLELSVKSEESSGGPESLFRCHRVGVAGCKSKED